MSDGAIQHGAQRARPGVTAVWAKPRAKLLLVGNSSAFNQLVPHALAGELLQPNSSVYAAGLGVCLWLRPDQRLLLLSHGVSSQSVRRRPTANAWALDAGARYVEFELAGEQAAAVLNTGCSLDLRTAAFAVEQCAQSRFDRVPIVIYRTAPDRFEVLTERPLASHLWCWLCRAVDDV